MYSNNIIIMLLCEQGVKEELKSTFTGDLNEQMTVFLPRRRISELEVSDVVHIINVILLYSIYTE